MSLAWPAWLFPSPARVHLSPQVSWNLLEFVFHDFTPLDVIIFEEKDRMENPSLNISLLCLAPKYLNLILWALSFGLHWRVDVLERASNHHGL